MASISPTSRTLSYYREQGYICHMVERRLNKFMCQDYMGIIDILALKPGVHLLGIQSTGSAFSQHRIKLTQTHALQSSQWLSLPNHHLILIGWRKIKAKRGGKQMVWAPRIEELTLESLTL